MTFSQTVPVWTEVTDAPQVSGKALGYLRAQFRNKLHQLILKEFAKREAAGFTKADLARRIHKSPPQINRLLAAPGNWTLDTVSDLLLGMSGRLAFSFVPFNDVDLFNVFPQSAEMKQKDSDQRMLPTGQPKMDPMQLLGKGEKMSGAGLGSIPI